MSFSFSFSGDDIESSDMDDDELDTYPPKGTSSRQDERDILIPQLENIRVGDGVAVGDMHLIRPKRHDFAELLSSLPSQISYNRLSIPSSPSSPTTGFPSSNAPPDNLLKIHTFENKPSTILRRSLFDIRTQLMAESDLDMDIDMDDNMNHDGHKHAIESSQRSTYAQLLSHIDSNDLTPKIYEGGFKTWECSLDLASYLLSRVKIGGDASTGDINGDGDGKSKADANGLDLSKNWHVIELGAGSAVPSLALLNQFLKGQSSLTAREDENSMSESIDQNEIEKRVGKLRLTLCDYNEDVLRLVTAANVFLSYHSWSISSSSKSNQSLQEKGDASDINGDLGEIDDLDIDLEQLNENTIQDLISELNNKGIRVDFISGAWGYEFLQLLDNNPIRSTLQDEQVYHNQQENVLVLASETIYSPESTEIFADLIIKLCQQKPSATKVWLAAKKIYFGVGGSVDDFTRQIIKRGGLVRELWNVPAAGVGRVIVEVKVG